MQPIIDTHIHFDDSRFDHDRDAVYQRAIDCGVVAMVVPAVTRARWTQVEAVSKNYKNVFATAGLHPVFCDDHQTSDLDQLEKKLQKGNCVAIGECGLDGYIKNTPLTMQKNYFAAQLELGKTFNLPVIIHARDAVEEVILLLKHHRLNNKTGNGVVHSYNGSLQQAYRLIDLGYRLSFGGPLSFTRSRRLHALVKKLPLDAMMLETDAPDQPTMKNRGNRNEPAYIGEVLTTIAALRNESATDIADSSNHNAQQLFNLDNIFN